jgi:hypothetical protein
MSASAISTIREGAFVVQGSDGRLIPPGATRTGAGLVPVVHDSVEHPPFGEFRGVVIVVKVLVVWQLEFPSCRLPVRFPHGIGKSLRPYLARPHLEAVRTVVVEAVNAKAQGDVRKSLREQRDEIGYFHVAGLELVSDFSATRSDQAHRPVRHLVRLIPVLFRIADPGEAGRSFQ